MYYKIIAIIITFSILFMAYNLAQMYKGLNHLTAIQNDQRTITSEMRDTLTYRIATF